MSQSEMKLQSDFMNKFRWLIGILLLVLFVVLILEYISLDNLTAKNESQQSVSQRSDMSFTEFDTTMISTKDLTTLQKENVYHDISLNKIYRWEGMVKDVTQNVVIIDIMRDVNYRNAYDVNNYYFKTSYYDDKILFARLGRAKILLHINDDQKSQLNSLSKDCIISFEGTLTPESIDPADNYKRKKSSGIDMYNGRIIEVINLNTGIIVY